MKKALGQCLALLLRSEVLGSGGLIILEAVNMALQHGILSDRGARPDMLFPASTTYQHTALVTFLLCSVKILWPDV